jgi:PEP-CTERM motif
VKLSKLFLALCLLLVASASNASSVTVTDPTNGGAYTLDVVLKAGTTSTYTVTLTADIGAANPLLNNAQYIDQAEFKISSSLATVTMLSAPSGATWTSGPGPLSSGGCGGTSGGFACIDASGGVTINGGITIGSTQVFVWQAEVTLAPGVPLDTTDWHIGVHYTRDDVRRVCTGTGSNRVCSNVTILGGKNAGIVSLSGTPPIPEPASVAVFGLGALMVGAALRKRASA